MGFAKSSLYMIAESASIGNRTKVSDDREPVFIFRLIFQLPVVVACGTVENVADLELDDHRSSSMNNKKLQ